MPKQFKDLRFEKIEDLTTEELYIVIDECSKLFRFSTRILNEITDLTAPLKLEADKSPIDVIRRLVKEKSEQVKAEREACAQIAREVSESAMRFSGPSASIYCAQIFERIEARNE